MSTALAAPASPVAHRAAADLLAVREQWGDLLAAIAHPPAEMWPPRETRGFLDQLAAQATAEAAPDDEPAVGRAPLILREHPAPLNLDALDAALDTERDLFDLADRVAAAVQRPIRTEADYRGRRMPDQADAADPARWHYQAPTSPGSRAHGMHWAAVWIEGRLLGEDTETGDLFRPVPPRLLDDAASTARRARNRVERALGRDGRRTVLDDPCPWCAGQLTGHTRAGGEPVVVCGTGPECTAPAQLERGSRAWRGRELVALWAALDAARRRAA